VENTEVKEKSLYARRKFKARITILPKFNLSVPVNPLNAELNPICHLLALLGGAAIVVVSRLRVNVLFPAGK